MHKLGRLGFTGRLRLKTGYRLCLLLSHNTAAEPGVALIITRDGLTFVTAGLRAKLELKALVKLWKLFLDIRHLGVSQINSLKNNWHRRLAR